MLGSRTEGTEFPAAAALRSRNTLHEALGVPPTVCTATCLSARRSFMVTYWPDLILPTTLADSGGSAEDRTMAWSALTGGRAASVG